MNKRQRIRGDGFLARGQEFEAACEGLEGVVVFVCRELNGGETEGDFGLIADDVRADLDELAAFFRICLLYTSDAADE